MSTVKVATSKLTALANAVRSKSGESEGLTLNDISIIIPSLATPSIPTSTWADGTDEEIAAMLNAHYDDNVDFNIYDHWKEGDKRNVQLSAMAATGVNEAHVAQTVTMVLVNKGGRTLSNGKECAFIWQQENCLANDTTLEDGDIISIAPGATNIGGWKDCVRRTWCNNVYYNALPTGFKTLVKQCTNKTSKGNKLTTLDETQDYCFLPAEFEVQGATTYAADNEATTQWGYYKTAANKVKKAGSSGKASSWWLRSPHVDRTDTYCGVVWSGAAQAYNITSSLGIAVAGCI